MFFKSITYERPAFNFVDVRREKSEWGETEDNEERSVKVYTRNLIVKESWKLFQWNKVSHLKLFYTIRLVT